MKIDDKRKHSRKVQVKDLEVRDTFETGSFILTKMSDDEYYDVKHCIVYTRGGGNLSFNNVKQCEFYSDLTVGLLNASLVIRPWSEVTDPSRGSNEGGESWDHKGKPAPQSVRKKPTATANPKPGNFY